MPECPPLQLPAGRPLAELLAQLPAERHPLLLHSGNQPGTWNLAAFDPLEVLRCQARHGGQAFAVVDEALARHFPDARGQPATQPASGLPAFRGGAAGYLGYDLGRELERLPERAARDGDLPDLLMGIHPFVLAERGDGGARCVVGRGSVAQRDRFVATVAELEAAATRAAPASALALPEAFATSSFTREAYLAAVARVREHILDGEIYQVNLAQRFELAWQGDPCRLQRALALRFPAEFGALLRAPDLSVVSSSPELFLRRRGRQVLSCPIKGTRPRGHDAAEDALARAELERSAKERAELAMIVDLVRNDLGRSAVRGSVEVLGEFATREYSTVFHRVATVRCEVAADLPATALVAAAFPPASVTGVPKIAAQGVIESLEPVRRHVYTGAIGWIGANGDLDLSVAIRIATATGGRLLLPVGGGLTLASEPVAEYDETLHKARALFEVLGLRWPPGAQEAVTAR